MKCRKRSKKQSREIFNIFGRLGAVTIGTCVAASVHSQGGGGSLAAVSMPDHHPALFLEFWPESTRFLSPICDVGSGALQCYPPGTARLFGRAFLFCSRSPPGGCTRASHDGCGFDVHIFLFLQLDEAAQIKNTDIAKELSLPPVKLHCSSECDPHYRIHP